MTIRQQWTLVAGIVAVLGLALFAATRIFADEIFPVAVGSRAPDFHASAIDGKPTTKTIADYKGQVVLLNVWATWCAPCRVEMPSIEALHERYGPKGLKVVAVSIDNAGNEQLIRDFRDGFKLSFEILHDASGEIQRSYQTTGYPETFVIGRDGIIHKKMIGASNWDSDANRRLIASLLGVDDGGSAIGGDTSRSTSVSVDSAVARPAGAR